MGRLCPPGKQTGSHKNCLPLKTWQLKMEMYTYTFISITMHAKSTQQNYMHVSSGLLRVKNMFFNEMLFIEKLPTIFILL